MLASKTEPRLRALRVILLGQLIPRLLGSTPVSEALLQRAAAERTLAAGLEVVRRQMPAPPRATRPPIRPSWRARVLAFLTKPFRLLFRR